MKKLWRRLRRRVSSIENVATRELPPLPENPGYIPEEETEESETETIKENSRGN